jgi:hypothetical protein
MIGVFYPYMEEGSSRAQLELSIESVKKYLHEEYELWVVGDPAGAGTDEGTNSRLHDHPVHWIPAVRNGNVHEPNLFDSTEKLRLYIEHRNSPEVFIRMYDDTYFINSRHLCDLLVTRYLFEYEELAEGLKSGGATWRAQVMRSVDAVRKLGYPGIMTETHCPEVFEKERMRTLFDRFNPAVNRMVTSTLYYNLYPWHRELKDRKVERALFYGSENEFSYGPGDIDEKAGMKYYLNHNDDGLNGELWDWLCVRIK